MLLRGAHDFLQPLVLITVASFQDVISEGIDTSRLQEYLLATSLRGGEPRSDKFAVDVLWTGIRSVSGLAAQFEKYDLRNSSVCLSALNRYYHALVGDQHEDWALKMYDSSSNHPSGFLTGNIQELGSYDECVSSEYLGPNSFSGMHCIVKVDDSTDPMITTRTLTDIPVTYSLCVPSACTADNIQEVLNIGRGLLYLKYPFKVIENNCYTGSSRPLVKADWIAIGIFTTLALLILLATSYNSLASPISEPQLRDLLASFSLVENWRKLVTVDRSREIISSLFGIRFIFMIWIVLIHRFSMLHTQPALGIFQWNSILQDWSRAIIINGFISVDTYFVMSGLLVSYTFLKRTQDKSMELNITKYYFHRYIRLTPALAGLVLMYSTFADLLCTGPYCSAYYTSIKASCVTNWWKTLFYVNNYVDNDNMCTIQGWYMSIDMQLVIISPLILLPLVHYPEYMRSVLGSLIAVAVSISYIQPYLNRISAGYYIVGKVEDHRIFLENYVYTHARASSWLMGIALGIYLREYMSQPSILSQKRVISCWVLAAISFLVVIFSIMPFQNEDHVYNPFWDTIYKATHRHVWAMATCWLIFASATGHGGIVNKFLSIDVFQPLGRLSYCLNLSHIIVQKWWSTSQRTPVNFNDVTKIPVAFGDIMASLFGALILYMMFEAPFRELERVIVGEDFYMDEKSDCTEDAKETEEEPQVANE